MPLGNGVDAWIDLEDFAKVYLYSWYLHSEGYAVASDGRDKLYLHRYIMGVTDPKIFVDHEDHDRLNNRKNNLRVCERTQNQWNRKPRGKFKGITYIPRKDKWQVRLRANGVVYNLGYYKDPVEAAKAHDRKAIELHGQFASLNFPKESYETAK